MNKDSVLRELFGKPNSTPLDDLNDVIARLDRLSKSKGVRLKAAQGNPPSLDNLVKALELMAADATPELANEMLSRLNSLTDQLRQSQAKTPATKARRFKDGIAQVYDPVLHLWLREE